MKPVAARDFKVVRRVWVSSYATEVKPGLEAGRRRGIMHEGKQQVAGAVRVRSQEGVAIWGAGYCSSYADRKRGRKTGLGVGEQRRRSDVVGIWVRRGWQLRLATRFAKDVSC